MANFVKDIGCYRVFKLNRKECKLYGRVYPTFVCWCNYDEYLGNFKFFGDMNFTANETRSVEDMVSWCKD